MGAKSIATNPDIYQQLLDAYSSKCGGSPSSLIGLLNSGHPLGNVFQVGRRHRLRTEFYHNSEANTNSRLA